MLACVRLLPLLIWLWCEPELPNKELAGLLKSITIDRNHLSRCAGIPSRMHYHIRPLDFMLETGRNERPIDDVYAYG